MDGSDLYEVTPSPGFKQKYSALVKRHYKKNKRARAKLDQLMDQFFSAFQTNPQHVPGAEFETWPAHCHNPLFHLFKLYFNMPGLRGEAGEGRLMFLVCDAAKTVDMIWVYTHAEYSGRPPDKDLRKLLEECMKRAAEHLTDNPLTIDTDVGTVRISARSKDAPPKDS